MSLFKKMFWGALLGGGAYFMFSKKGKQIREELQEKAPALLAEVKKRVADGRHTYDQAVETVVSEWERTKKIMKESAEPIKKELRRHVIRRG